MLLRTNIHQGLNGILDSLSEVEGSAGIPRYHVCLASGVVDQKFEHHCTAADVLKGLQSCRVASSWTIISTKSDFRS